MHLVLAFDLGSVPSVYQQSSSLSLERVGVSLEDPSETYLNIEKVKFPSECCSDLLKFGVYIEFLHLTEDTGFISQYQITSWAVFRDSKYF